MKKIYLLFLGILFMPAYMFSQDIPILFSVTQSNYELLENPISVNNGEIWQPDDNYAVYFNFDFWINGQVYTALVVNAGIGLTFPGNGTKQVWIWGGEWGGWPFLFDRGTDVSESPIDYEIVGDPGSRILKIQWQNAGIRDNEGDDPDDYVNFQMWVCEGTDRIEIHYGSSQTSDLSFGYNDGPSVRFYGIEGNWGICVNGYADMPSWSWTLFEGPVGGCLLDGVPSENIIYNFFPNPEVSVDEITANKNADFKIIQNNRLDELEVQINDFNPGETYKLTIYNSIGMKLDDLNLHEKDTYLNIRGYEKGMYIFVLRNSTKTTTQKFILSF